MTGDQRPLRIPRPSVARAAHRWRANSSVGRIRPITNVGVARRPRVAALDSIPHCSIDDWPQERTRRPARWSRIVWWHGSPALLVAFSILIALEGLYGVLAHLAVQRTREIGPYNAWRRARHVVRLILRDGIRPVGFGIICGLVFSDSSARCPAPIRKSASACELDDSGSCADGVARGRPRRLLFASASSFLRGFERRLAANVGGAERPKVLFAGPQVTCQNKGSIGVSPSEQGPAFQQNAFPYAFPDAGPTLPFWGAYRSDLSKLRAAAVTVRHDVGQRAENHLGGLTGSISQFDGDLHNELNAILAALTSDMEFEACNQDVRYTPGCQKSGDINYPPYASCLVPSGVSHAQFQPANDLLVRRPDASERTRYVLDLRAPSASGMAQVAGTTGGGSGCMAGGSTVAPPWCRSDYPGNRGDGHLRKR